MKMKRWAFLLIFYCIWALFSYDTVCAQPSETVSSYVLSDLQHESYPEFSRIIFSSNDRIDFTYYELHNPYRIVIDLLGVSFCELQEYVEYDEGLVESIDLVKSPYAQRPQGLDEYFYAIDCIIVTPRADFPYTVSSAENGKIIALDIGTKAPPKLSVSYVSKAESGEPESLSSESESHTPIISQMTNNNIIDYINLESVDDSILVVVSSAYEVVCDIKSINYPCYALILEPRTTVYTGLEAYTELDTGFIKSIQIAADEDKAMPSDLDEPYYPVKYIIVETADEPKFDFYANKDNTISILEIYCPVIKKQELPVIDKVITEEPMPVITREPYVKLESKEESPVHSVEEEDIDRTELLKELKEYARKELKEYAQLEDVRREEIRTEAKAEHLERIKKDAAKKAEGLQKEFIHEVFIVGKGTLGLNQLQLTALENDPQAKTAKEEVKLAARKRRDAFRALFPDVKLKVSHTTGDVFDDIAFTEEVYGVSAEHPIYQSGRLMNTYKQSKVNAELSEARYQKIEHDINFKVAEAYHSAVTAIMNIKLQKELRDEAEPILRLAEKRHSHGLSTKLEMLNVQSRYNQIEFQIATAERDLALAKFKLQQATGLDLSDDEIDISEIDTELPFKVIDVNLYECLEAASNNHPDILVNSFLVESNEYGEKISKGKYGLRVDLTGFYGRADSYYNTEPKNLQADWNVGVKVSKPFWFASPSYSFTKDKTSRKVGDTDRTGTTVHAGELSLLDKEAFSAISDIDESRINRQKAENDLLEAKRQIAMTIKESYYNYQEAVIQVKNALEKTRFHEESVKVARMQSELNEALQSQLLESLIQLVDEKSVYIKALSDYNLAIIKLNNAIGVKDYFKVD
jgi:outer membrane protein TolC